MAKAGEIAQGNALHDVLFDAAISDLTASCVGSDNAGYVLSATCELDASLSTSCTCPAFEKDRVCKHLLALLFWYVDGLAPDPASSEQALLPATVCGPGPVNAPLPALPLPATSVGLPSLTQTPAASLALPPTPCPVASSNLPSLTYAGASSTASGSVPSLTPGGTAKRRTPKFLTQAPTVFAKPSSRAGKPAAVGGKDAGPPAAPKTRAVPAPSQGREAQPSLQAAAPAPLQEPGCQQDPDCVLLPQPRIPSRAPPRKRKAPASLPPPCTDPGSHSLAREPQRRKRDAGMGVQALDSDVDVSEEALLQACHRAKLPAGAGASGRSAATPAATTGQHGAPCTPDTRNERNAAGLQARPRQARAPVSEWETMMMGPTTAASPRHPNASPLPASKQTSIPEPDVQDLTELVDLSMDDAAPMLGHMPAAPIQHAHNAHFGVQLHEAAPVVADEAPLPIPGPGARPKINVSKILDESDED